jgi:hypothetical protein
MPNRNATGFKATAVYLPQVAAQGTPNPGVTLPQTSMPSRSAKALEAPAVYRPQAGIQAKPSPGAAIPQTLVPSRNAPGLKAPAVYRPQAGIQAKPSSASQSAVSSGSMLLPLIQRQPFARSLFNTVVQQSPGQGAQDLVQHKLIRICKYLDAVNLLEPDPFRDEWYKAVRLNGLCGGWVEVHKRKPFWIEELWEAVTSWTPTRGASKQQKLDNLNIHLSNTIPWCNQGEGAILCRDLLATAWQHMDVLEPAAGYGPLPGSVPATTGQSTLTLLATTTSQIQFVNAGNSAVLSLQALMATEKLDQCIAHIETDYHHMSVRVESSQPPMSAVVLETENLGVKRCSSWQEVAHSLENGLYLDDASHDDTSIEIKLFALP